MLAESTTMCPDELRKDAVPRWFFVALAVLVLLATITIGMATSAPIRIDVVIALFGGLALAHGFTTGRWWIAAPVAVLTFALTVGAVVALPAANLTIQDGPADSMGVRAIWLAATVIVACDIAVGVRLHRVANTSSRNNNRLVAQLASQQQAIERQIEQLHQRAVSVDELLTTAS